MGREGKDKGILEVFAADFVRIVEKYAKYAVVAGFVAIAHGRSRSTEDIDIIIERIPKERFAKMHKELVGMGVECVQAPDPDEIYDEYLSKNLSVRYVRNRTHIPQIELKLSKDALDDYQLETRKRLPLTGLDFYFSSIEMNIAFKEELLRSERDMEDARHLRVVYGTKINEEEIEKIKQMIRTFRLK